MQPSVKPFVYGFNGDAVALHLRGSEGDLAVLAGHIPFMTAVQPGECRIEFDGEPDKVGVADGGLLTVFPDSVTLLSSSFKWKE